MLFLNEIERKPKRIERARSYRISVKLSDDLIAHVEEILYCIESGTPLPTWAYRANHETTTDILLERMGIMHLHIGSKASRELVYLIQFDDRVVLLEISDHSQLRDEPRGTILGQMHRTILQDIQRAEAKDAMRKAEDERSSEENRKRLLAKGVEKLKSRKPPG